MLSVIEAQEKIAAALSPLGTERVELSSAAGRILAESIQADHDLPPFSNSSVDGFAVHLADIETAAERQGITLPVVMDIAAGTVPPAALKPGTAARVMTGAPVPADCDCVIPIEDTDYDPDRYAAQSSPAITIFTKGSPGQGIRPQGQDIKRGELALEAGQPISAQALGLLATLGHAQPLVYRKPKIAVLATGDELIAPEEALKPGKIRESNTYTLTALLEKAGAVALRLPPAADDPQVITSRLNDALEMGSDLILTSAGVSVGAYDYVRTVIEQNGELNFWRVNVRPGKPLAFGHYHGCPLIGLPGNPVSSFVGFQLFVLPAIYRLAGRRGATPLRVTAVLEEPLETDGRETYARAVLENRGSRLVARLSGHQGSGNLVALVRSNALLIVPSGVKSLPAGATITAWLIDG